MRGFPGRDSSQSALQVHFVHCHVREILVVLEEGNHPLRRCPKCDIFVMWWNLSGNHQVTAMCARGADWWLKRLREEEAQLSTVVAFEVY